MLWSPGLGTDTVQVGAPSGEEWSLLAENLDRLGRCEHVINQVASAKRELSQPLAYVVYAVVGVGVLFLATAFTSTMFGLDVWQLCGIWLALTAAVCVLTAAGERHHRALWLALIAALLFSFLQNYAEYISLRGRLPTDNTD